MGVAGLTWGHNIQQLERELCSKMPMIKFSYFDIEAKGELTRLLLHAGNFDFEDDRLPISSWPGEHKEKTTFGQLPMLSWDGVELAQSMAIARFVARRAGLAGRTDLEFVQADMVLFSSSHPFQIFLRFFLFFLVAVLLDVDVVG